MLLSMYRALIYRNTPVLHFFQVMSKKGKDAGPNDTDESVPRLFSLLKVSASCLGVHKDSFFCGMKSMRMEPSVGQKR